MNIKDFTIGILGITAVILLTALVLSSNIATPRAEASYMSARGGDYVMWTGQLQGSEELLYVLDAGMGRVIVYRFDVNTPNFVAVSDALRLKDLPSRQKSSAKPPKKKRRR